MIMRTILEKRQLTTITDNTVVEGPDVVSLGERHQQTTVVTHILD